MADAEAQVDDPMLVAVKSVQLEVDGQVFVLAANATQLRSGHPACQANPELFKPVGGAAAKGRRPRARSKSR
jgi:hypothetical protein